MYTNPAMRRGSSAAKSHMAWVRSHQGNRPKKRGGKRAKRNFYSAGEVANPPRFIRRAKKTVVRYVKRYTRNSPAAGAQTRTLMGLPVPALEPLAGAVLGFVAPPVLHSFIGGFIPAAIQENTFGRYLVRAAEVVVPSMLVRRFVNARVGNYMLIAGAAKIVIDAISEFAPGVVPGLGWQPMLGAYTQRHLPGQAYAARNVLSVPALSAGVPGRLTAATRF